MNIVILDGYALNPGDLSWEAFETFGNVTVYDRTPNELVSERIRGAEVVYTNKTILNREIIENADALKFIGVLATGVNIVDLDAAREKGIPVANVPAYSTPSVAQMTISLLLELCLHVGDHSRLVHEGEWTVSPDFCFWRYPLIELEGKTLGIIGLGSIGRAVAKIASAFGMRVIAYRGRGEGVEMR
ncbi:MAG: D-2-hydroxyacid dehydrogenase, partial [Kiritimatiellae bacterium]|nr:D-2-hydroxyacid dehydrogenase [Kiritimatiellia bacterium]